MPPHPSRVSNEYASRTPCSKHSIVYSGEPQGSRRHITYSQCEYTDGNFRCRYSHTAFNTKRIVKLAKSGNNNTTNIVKLEYGFGFERYGSHDSTDSGWDVKLNEANISWGSRRWNLPKSILLAELRTGISVKNGPAPQYEKKQSICSAHQNAICMRSDGCKFDHDIVESKRLEALGEKCQDGPGLGDKLERDYLVVECHVSNDSESVTWKINLKPDALKRLRGNSLGSQAIDRTEGVTYSGDDLLEIVKRLEADLGISKV